MIIKWMLVMYIDYVTCTIIYFYCEWLSEQTSTKLSDRAPENLIRRWSKNFLWLAKTNCKFAANLQKPIVFAQNSVGALLSIYIACLWNLFILILPIRPWVIKFFSGTSDWYMRECLSCMNFLFVCSIISYFRSCLLLVYLSFTFLHITFKLFRQKQLLSNFYHSLMTENQMKNDQPMMNFDKTQRLMTSNSQQH